MAPAVFSLRLSAAGLAQGLEVFGAVEQAKRVVTVAIEDGLPLAAGHGPANPLVLLKSVKPVLR
jgi:hydroxymethylpyrimidine/phosphomethylpyrimidine kinase